MGRKGGGREGEKGGLEREKRKIGLREGRRENGPRRFMKDFLAYPVSVHDAKVFRESAFDSTCVNHLEEAYFA